MTLILLTACAKASPAVAPASAPAEVAPAAPPASTTTPLAPPVVLTADTVETTARGATFTVPAGWAISSHDGCSLVRGPEADLRVAVIESVNGAPDEAVAAAWKSMDADFKRTPKVITPRPGRRGWDERRDYEYETSPDEKLVLGAVALRQGKEWTIFLLDSGAASFDKRASDVIRIQGSMRPRGYVRETFAGKTAHLLDAHRVEAIVDAMDRAREATGLPGVAIALVQDGKTIYEGGLGVRELGKPAKIDAHTRFMIASNTKALTTLLLAKLVDAGKLTWDTPATSLLPTFRLGDGDTTRQVLVKHLICACTGLPRQDFEWLFEYEKSSPEKAVGTLATMQPTTKFGETFQYSNPLAAAAGYLAGHVLYPSRELGAAYDDAMQVEVLGPLGMTETTFDFARALNGDHAAPYEYDVDGKMAPAVMDLNRSMIPVRPAGGAWSTVHDMAKYVAMELAAGKLPDGKRYISEDALLARRKPQVRLGEFATYGMGLMVDDEWGVEYVHHGGDVFGYHSDMFWIPSAGVGGVILTSGPGWLIRRAFIRKTFEVLFDGQPEAEDDVATASGQARAEIAAERPRLTLPAGSAVAATLARRYTSASLGDIVVKAGGDSVVFDFGGWRSEMASRKNDDGTSSMITVSPGAPGLAFVVAERDGKRALIVRDMQHEYAFLEAK